MVKYLKKQFQLSMFNVEHHSVSDFYLSCWQNNRSPLPLLCVRTVIFLGCLGTILSSMILTGMSTNIGYWFIYLTHWGLILNLIATCCSVIVSWQAYMKGPLEASFELPWFFKVFWVFYNIAVVMAFIITIYYYALLQDQYEDMELAVDPVLDVFIHAINSVLMFLLLMTSRHPGRMLHFIYPVALGTAFVIFSVIYYFAGGIDPFGNPYIYPTLDWASPGQTTIMVLVTAIGIIAMHAVVVGMTAGRNWLAKRYGGLHSKSMDIQYS